VYKKDIDSLKTQNGTLQTLIEAILNVGRSFCGLPSVCHAAAQLTWTSIRMRWFMTW